VCYATDSANCASIEDVVFGDVFLCSGQSNMAYGLSSAHSEPEDWREHLRFSGSAAPDLLSEGTSINAPWGHGELPGIRLLTIAREIGGEDDITTSLNVSFTTPYVRPLWFLVTAAILTRTPGTPGRELTMSQYLRLLHLHGMRLSFLPFAFSLDTGIISLLACLLVLSARISEAQKLKCGAAVER